MNWIKRVILIAASGSLAAGPQGRALAQCRLCDQPATQLPTDSADGDVQLQVEASLSFDRLVLAGSGNGAAIIRADGGSSREGAVLSVSPRATVGIISVHGAPNRALRVQMPHRIELYSLSGGRITLDDVTSDLASSPRLDAAGNLSFHFGGRLLVTSDTDGQYRGDLPITVEYV
jgi:hypothetical protein